MRGATETSFRPPLKFIRRAGLTFHPSIGFSISLLLHSGAFSNDGREFLVNCAGIRSKNEKSSISFRSGRSHFRH